jgi:outer membrane protein
LVFLIGATAFRPAAKSTRYQNIVGHDIIARCKMFKCKTMMLAIILTVAWTAVPCMGADVAKIGVVDIQKILLTSSAGKMAKAQINKKAREMETKLTEKKEEIDKLKETLEREALVMSKETREEREREIRIKINDIKSLKQKYEKDLKTIEGKVVKRIQIDMGSIVEELGKKEGYLLIVTSQAVLYAPSTIDITDQLIQLYNTSLAEKGGDFNIDTLE